MKLSINYDIVTLHM